MVDKNIQRVFRDFVNFDITGNYYNVEEKDEIVRRFKKILNEDDQTVRQFLKAFFEQTKKLATEFSLVSNDEEAVKEEPDEEEEENEEGSETEPEEEEVTDEPVETTEEQPEEGKPTTSTPPPVPEKVESVEISAKEIFDTYTEAANDFM